MPTISTKHIQSVLGVLQILDPPDRETKPFHSLTVRATDVTTGFSSDTLLQVAITDVNDCYPTFLHDSYRLSVVEGAPVGTNLSRIVAVDCDLGEYIFGALELSML